MTAQIESRHIESEGFSSITGSDTRHWYRPPYTRYSQPRTIGEKVIIDDVTGNFRRANPFYLDRKEYREMTISFIQRYSDGRIRREVVEYPLSSGTAFGTPDPYSHWDRPNVFSDAQAANRILANSNPNQPHVSVPIWFGEMVDSGRTLAGMVNLLRSAGRFFIDKLGSYRTWTSTLTPAYRKLMAGLNVNDISNSLNRNLAKAGNANINYQFGVRPLIGDVVKFVTAASAIESRMKQLQRAKEGKPLTARTRLRKETYKGEWSSETTLHSETCHIRGRYRINYSIERWGSVRYNLPSSFEIPNSWRERLYLAARQTYGIDTFEAISTAWELLPWSWLIDYFSETQAFIARTRNVVPYTHSDLCLMEHVVAEREYEITQKPDYVTLSGVRKEKHEIKQRRLVAPYPLFPISVPGLKPRQWSILGSLAVLNGSSIKRARRG